MLGEPTNDLDVDTLAALEDLLDGWPGTLVVVSHDRYLLERVCDEQYAVLGDGALRHLPGGVAQYLELRGSVPPASIAPSGAGAGQASTTSGPSAAEQREARKALARIERQIEQLTVKQQRLHAQLAEHASDFEKVRELNAALRDIDQEKAGLEEQWLESAELAD